MGLSCVQLATLFSTGSSTKATGSRTWTSGTLLTVTMTMEYVTASPTVSFTSSGGSITSANAFYANNTPGSFGILTQYVIYVTTGWTGTLTATLSGGNTNGFSMSIAEFTATNGLFSSTPMNNIGANTSGFVNGTSSTFTRTATLLGSNSWCVGGVMDYSGVFTATPVSPTTAVLVGGAVEFDATGDGDGGVWFFGDSLSVQPSRPAGASLTLGVTYSANKGGQVGWIEVLDPTTVVLVNQAGNGNTTGATSLSVTITAPTIGNLMILEIASWDGVTSLQTPAISGAGVTTWAQAGNVYDTRSKYSLGTWIGTVDAAPTTTISLTGFRTGTFAVAKVSEWTGLPAVTGTFTTATQGAANPSITATIPSSCALAIAMTTLEDDLFGTAPTGGTAMTDAGTSGSSNTLSSQYSIAPAAGSITYGWTNAAGSFNGVLMLTVSAYTASSNSGTSTSSTASVILPAWNVNPGNDTIVLFVASTVSVTFTTPTGYRILEAKSGTAPCGIAYIKDAGTVSGDSSATVSIPLSGAASWTVQARVYPNAGLDIASAIKNGSTASTSAAFAALTPTLGSADGGILVEFIAGMPGSGQTDTLTLPASYANSATTASTKSASVNMSAGSWDSTSVATANTSYTPPTVTQSVSVKYVNFAFSLRPKQALPVTDTFTGTNGAAWTPANWAPTALAAGTATIQSNAGQLSNSDGYQNTALYLAGALPTVDTDLSVDVTLGDYTKEQFVSIAWRSDGSADPGGGSGTNNGYELALLPSYGLLELSKQVAGVNTILGTDPPFTFQSGALHVRITHIGNVVNIYAWYTGSQPGTPTYAYTDSSSPYTTAGSLWLGFESGTTGVGTETATFDNVSFGFPAVTGTAVAAAALQWIQG